MAMNQLYGFITKVDISSIVKSFLTYLILSKIIDKIVIILLEKGN